MEQPPELDVVAQLTGARQHRDEPDHEVQEEEGQEYTAAECVKTALASSVLDEDAEVEARRVALRDDAPKGHTHVLARPQQRGVERSDGSEHAYERGDHEVVPLGLLACVDETQVAVDVVHGEAEVDH